MDKRVSKTVLVVAAHPDDEVLGCGGAIAQHVISGCNVFIVFMADGVSSRLQNHNKKVLEQQRMESAKKSCGILGANPPLFMGFPDNQMDTVPMLKMIQALEDVMHDIKPSIIYTHHRQDLNIDHKITHDIVMTACRPQPGFYVNKILCFEVPSSTNWNDLSVSNFNPNYFVDINKTIRKKMAALEVYKDEMRNFPHVRSIEAIKSLIKYRGSTVGYAAAEAFTVARIIKTS